MEPQWGAGSEEPPRGPVSCRCGGRTAPCPPPTAVRVCGVAPGVPRPAPLPAAAPSPPATMSSGLRVEADIITTGRSALRRWANGDHRGRLANSPHRGCDAHRRHLRNVLFALFLQSNPHRLIVSLRLTSVVATACRGLRSWLRVGTAVWEPARVRTRKKLNRKKIRRKSAIAREAHAWGQRGVWGGTAARLAGCWV